MSMNRFFLDPKSPEAADCRELAIERLVDAGLPEDALRSAISEKFIDIPTQGEGGDCLCLFEWTAGEFAAVWSHGDIVEPLDEMAVAAVLEDISQLSRAVGDVFLAMSSPGTKQ